MCILAWVAHDVLKLCRECGICARDHANPSLMTTLHSQAFGSGFKYGADIGEVDGYPHVIVVDYYSFTVFECPLPLLAANSVITAFKTIFSDSGVPMTLVTDNATCFINQGITKTLARGRSCAYLSGLTHDVLKLCRECGICVEDHANPSLTTTLHSQAFGPGFKYGTDIGEVDGYPHLIVVDYYSFTVFECPLPLLAANSVITVFKTIFSDSGVPMILVTDNATCFINEDFEEFS